MSGVLEADEVIKPLVSLGLSSDSNFARKIVNALDPRTKDEKGKTELRITLADFVKIFKTDKVSESLIAVINKETERRAQMRQSVIPVTVESTYQGNTALQRQRT